MQYLKLVAWGYALTNEMNALKVFCLWPSSLA